MLSMTPAAAQPQQTAEGARTFLGMQLISPTVQARIFLGGYWSPISVFTMKQGGARSYHNGAGPIESAVFSACVATIRVGIYPPREGSSFNSFTTSWLPIEPVTIDFSRVTDIAVTQEGPSQWLSLVGVPNSFQIRVESESLRPRIQYALEFLRQHCDPATATGF
jgi:hypothetical protein